MYSSCHQFFLLALVCDIVPWKIEIHEYNIPKHMHICTFIFLYIKTFSRWVHHLCGIIFVGVRKKTITSKIWCAFFRPIFYFRPGIHLMFYAYSSLRCTKLVCVMEESFSVCGVFWATPKLNTTWDGILSRKRDEKGRMKHNANGQVFRMNCC